MMHDRSGCKGHAARVAPSAMDLISACWLTPTRRLDAWRCHSRFSKNPRSAGPREAMIVREPQVLRRLISTIAQCNSAAAVAGALVAFDSAAQRAFFVARLRGGVNRSAIAAIADGTRR